ncbi:RAMP superfamily CRISPR-associated protein [Actinomyces ruminicola]|uniref:RAMP superfamily CRISPR-associated protein n=1 Tax=Actinomyces ruminicola TaxID=332524 RepID=UPI0011C71907|nr:RAMP superfamily CRISPR-associated protein [Actinomyces ruminicola]
MSVTRYELTVHLKTDSPIHSGGPEEAVDRSRNNGRSVDSEVTSVTNPGDASQQGDDSKRSWTPRRFARDGAGNPVLTGRSIKGALRAAVKHVAKAEDGDDVSALDALWGSLDRASALTVHPITLSSVATADKLPLRAGIAVDRYWGTAADTALFAHEIVPQDEKLTLRITARTGSVLATASDSANQDGEHPEEDRAERDAKHAEKDTGAATVERLFSVVLGALEAGLVSFGKRKGTGWGRVRINHDVAEPWSLKRTRLDSPAGLATWLDGGEQTRIQAFAVTPPERIRIAIAWNSPTGILVAETKKDEPPRRNVDEPGGELKKTDPTLPLRTHPSTELKGKSTGPLVIPGSSVRGALRGRASRIARTILYADVDASSKQDPDWSRLDVHKQLADDALLVRLLFGTTAHRGALTVLETLATVAQKDEPKAREVTHNAGDRWTGGVAGGALYSEEFPLVSWNDIRLEVDPQMLLTGVPDGGDIDYQRAALCLLGLVLAELSTGTLPLGSRSTRGMGQVEVTRMRIEGPDGLIAGGKWEFTADGNLSIAEQLLDRLRHINDQIKVDIPEGWSALLNGTGRQS